MNMWPPSPLPRALPLTQIKHSLWNRIPCSFQRSAHWVANTYLVVFDTFLFCFKRKTWKGWGKERKAEREGGGRERGREEEKKEEEEEEEEEGREENQEERRGKITRWLSCCWEGPVSFSGWWSPPDITNNCNRFTGRQHRQCLIFRSSQLGIVSCTLWWNGSHSRSITARLDILSKGYELQFWRPLALVVHKVQSCLLWSLVSSSSVYSDGSSPGFRSLPT